MTSIAQMMPAFIQDLRYAVRTLAHVPGFSAVVVMTLGLGIGANTAIFSLMDQVLLRMLPVPHPEELVQLDGPGPFRGNVYGPRTFSYPMYRDLRDGNDVFTGLVARAPASVALAYRGQSERIDAELVSGNTFGVLGVRPALGRALTPADDTTAGGHPVIMLGHGFWQQRFAGDPSILNQVVTVNSTPMTVVGVAPRGFHGIVSVQAPDIFVPLTMKAQVTPTRDDLEDRQSRWLNIVGRLKPGLDVQSAKAALDVVYRQINEEELITTFSSFSPETKAQFRAKQLTLYPAGRGLSNVRGSVSTPLYVLMAMVGLVLLIACANVANLLLTRATGRQREMAVRLALGAGRLRLVRQTLVESLVLAMAGGGVGLVLSIWLGDALVGLMSTGTVAEAVSTTPDLRVAAFTACLSLVTAVVFGLTPALQGSRLELNRTLREDAGSLSGNAAHARIRKGLVVAQVALSMLLVSGAGLFTRSLSNLESLDPGFDTNQLVSFSVDPALRGYDQGRVQQFYETLVARLEELPGVASATIASVPALTGSVSQRTIRVAGYESKPDENMNPHTNAVGAGYFRTLGIPLVAGRAISERDSDGAPRVAVVNETFARYFFGDDNPIGRRIYFSPVSNPLETEIIGVVKDARYENLREGATGDNETPRFVYTPYQQSGAIDEMTVYVRGAGGAATDLPARIRQAVAGVDAAVPVYAMQAFDATVDEALVNERMLVMLSVAFGLLATVIAAVGLYGVMSYTVTRRTREIGIRIALGAARGTVIGMVLREVGWLTIIGVALGIPGALAASRLVESQLFGISPTDPLTLAIAAGTLAIVALLAGWVPARRAAVVQPALALRSE